MSLTAVECSKKLKDWRGYWMCFLCDTCGVSQHGLFFYDDDVHYRLLREWVRECVQIFNRLRPLPTPHLAHFSRILESNIRLQIACVTVWSWQSPHKHAIWKSSLRILREMVTEYPSQKCLWTDKSQDLIWNVFLSGAGKRIYSRGQWCCVVSAHHYLPTMMIIINFLRRRLREKLRPAWSPLFYPLLFSLHMTLE